MLFLLISVLLLGLLLSGAGCLFAKILGFSLFRNPILYFWFGFCIVSALSMAASLFVPLNFIGLGIFFIVGGAGLPFFYRAYKQSTAQYNSVEVKIFKFVIFLVFFFLVCLSAYTTWTGAYDTDLYHAQTVRWYNEYGTPPGLGNLHTRLAFNSSWLSLAALFDNGIWDSRSPWLMPVMALSGGTAYCLFELFFARKKGVRVYALCILIWLGLLARRIVPSLYYDDPVHILNGIIVLEAYYLISSYKQNLDQKEAATLLLLSVSAFMIKPIAALSLFFCGVLTLWLLIRNEKHSLSAWIRIYAPSFCAFVIWISRNIVLSGYIMYPLPILALPFDWTMSFEAVKGNYNDIVGWARMPGPGYLKSLENGFWFWFKPWLIENMHSRDFMRLAVIPSCLFMWLWFLAVRYAGIKKIWYFLAWTFSSILYWFLTAPDIRFGIGFFWVCLGTPFLFLLPNERQLDISGIWKNPILRQTFFYLWGLGLIAGIGLDMASSRRDLLSIGKIPSRPVKEYIVNTAQPFTVWIPDSDDGDDRTGNSPLPSAPYAPSGIAMRENGNLGKGFRQDTY